MKKRMITVMIIVIMISTFGLLTGCGEKETTEPVVTPSPMESRFMAQFPEVENVHIEDISAAEKKVSFSAKGWDYELVFNYSSTYEDFSLEIDAIAFGANFGQYTYCSYCSECIGPVPESDEVPKIQYLCTLKILDPEKFGTAKMVWQDVAINEPEKFEDYINGTYLPH